MVHWCEVLRFLFLFACRVSSFVFCVCVNKIVNLVNSIVYVEYTMLVPQADDREKKKTENYQHSPYNLRLLFVCIRNTFWKNPRNLKLGCGIFSYVGVKCVWKFFIYFFLPQLPKLLYLFENCVPWVWGDEILSYIAHSEPIPCQSKSSFAIIHHS